MKIHNELQMLIDASVIDEATAQRIRRFYQERQEAKPNRLFIVFGVLGATLVGLGIILIIGHNWDQLPRALKTAFAFIPLVVGQSLGIYALLKRSDSMAWRESTAAFITFAVGACIAMISQIYHIQGELSGFLLTWSLLSLPLIYVLRSSVVSLLYLVAITFYAYEVGYWVHPNTPPYLYLLLLAAMLPHYYNLHRNNPDSNFMSFHNWFVPLSVASVFGAFYDNYPILLYVGYIALFGFLLIVGEQPHFQNRRSINNGYKVLGSLGSIIMLIVLSFEDVWKGIQR
ncbi:MAG: DUF2157 domain-containing protein, partial [Bacteroidota bacterium]